MVEEIKRLNMRELRDALNKLPKEWLEQTSIAPDTCTDFPDGEFGLVTKMDDEEWTEEVVQNFSTKETRLIRKRLVNFLNKDLKVLRSRENEEDFDEEYGIEPDW